MFIKYFSSPHLSFYRWYNFSIQTGASAGSAGRKNVCRSCWKKKCLPELLRTGGISSEVSVMSHPGGVPVPWYMDDSEPS
jgi:hypothetical protein